MHFVIARLVLTECWAMRVAVGIFVDGEVPGVVAPLKRALGGVVHTRGLGVRFTPKLCTPKINAL